MKQIIFTLSLLVCVILTSTAQTPQLFNYQATLRDNSGQLLVSEDISMRISILQFSTNGSPVYTETHAATTTSQGIINLKIGSGTGADEFASINWSNGPYFLKIEIDTENSGTFTELGVTQLLSVPYALYAEKARSILNDSVSYWSKNLNNLYYNDGLVGVGTNNPVSKLNIVGAIESGSGRNLLQLKNNTDNALSYTGISLTTGSSTGHSVIQDYGSTYTASTSYDFAGFLNVANSNRGVMLQANSADGVIKFYTGHNEMMSAGVERMRIDQNGNIGIGTANPTTKLYIESNVQDGQDRSLIRLRNTNTGEKSSVSIALESNDRTYGTAFTQTSASYSVIPDFDRMGVISTNGKGFSIYSVSDYGSIRFYTNRNENGIIERMRINASGNVGIGTNNPVAKLNIVGNVDEGDERSLIRLQNNSTGPKATVSIALQSFENKGVALGYASGNYSMNDLADFGSITTNGRGLALISYYGQIRFYTNKNLDNTYSEKMRINEAGNVGIGTTTPNARLEIAEGDVYIKDINKGIIMTSPDGQCWRGTINNSGVLEFTPTDCP